MRVSACTPVCIIAEFVVAALASMVEILIISPYTVSSGWDCSVSVSWYIIFTFPDYAPILAYLL